MTKIIEYDQNLHKLVTKNFLKNMNFYFINWIITCIALNMLI
ncbi:hypothetical protein CNEO3_930009 [Clostridium neonatale]|nr:hypothetical protein CNEO3_930009 [Clostridium neonatale]